MRVIHFLALVAVLVATHSVSAQEPENNYLESLSGLLDSQRIKSLKEEVLPELVKKVQSEITSRLDQNKDGSASETTSDASADDGEDDQSRKEMIERLVYNIKEYVRTRISEIVGEKGGDADGSADLVERIRSALLDAYSKQLRPDLDVDDVEAESNEAASAGTDSSSNEEQGDGKAEFIEAVEEFKKSIKDKTREEVLDFLTKVYNEVVARLTESLNDDISSNSNSENNSNSNSGSNSNSKSDSNSSSQDEDDEEEQSNENDDDDNNNEEVSDSDERSSQDDDDDDSDEEDDDQSVFGILLHGLITGKYSEEDFKKIEDLLKNTYGIDFFDQFAPEIKDVINKRAEFFAALENVNSKRQELNIARIHFVKAAFEATLLEFKATIRDMVQKKKAWIKTMVKLEKELSRALNDLVHYENVTIEPVEFLKVLGDVLSRPAKVGDLVQQFAEWLVDLDSREDGRAFLNDLVNHTYVEDDFLKIEEYLLNIEGISEILPKINEVIEKRSQFFEALKRVVSIRQQFDEVSLWLEDRQQYEVQLQQFQIATEDMVQKKKEWIDALVELKKEIVDGFNKLANEAKEKINPADFFAGFKNLNGQTVNIEDLVNQYAEWTQSEDKESKPFVYKSNSNEIDLAAAHGVSAQDDAGSSARAITLVVLGCVGIAVGVAVVGGVVYKKKQRKSLYTRLPATKENMSLDKMASSEERVPLNFA